MTKIRLLHDKKFMSPNWKGGHERITQFLTNLVIGIDKTMAEKQKELIKNIRK
ncbi:hypothetical protein WJR50_32880 [Catalinimonas sp. 4WD22]|uniref:hypothetical protein n=1 Tax=Catalinimonas locisalis TaxID=3133978 RepID=UPI003100DE48